jgi:hypothetical protein
MVSPTRPNVIFALGVLALFSVVSLAIFHPATRTFCFPPHSVLVQKAYERKVHLLVPINKGAAKKSEAFCKTLLSTLIHGYEPIIINWDVDHNWEFMQRLKVIGM